MENGQIKSLSLTKTKLAENEGEHTITFVASSSNEDRDFERLDIGTFRLPLKGGGEIRVVDLPQGGADNVDIPLLTDHDLWSVDKVIGSVRRASYENGELVFEAGISSIPRAQELFKLVEEGHLDNAFSIQYRDYKINPQTQVQTDGEIIEVSLVTRGANPDARVLATKSVKGINVEKEESTPEVVEEKDDKLVEAAEEVADTKEKAEEPATAEEPEAVAEEAPAEVPEAEVKEITKEKGIAESGFRVVNNCGEDGGQTVKHIHFHIIGGEKLGGMA
jgi:HK97 family phage prohead protease